MEKLRLRICGQASANVIKSFFKNESVGRNEVILFCDYSGFDIPIGYVFKEVLDLKTHTKTPCKIKLSSVTQGIGVQFPSIPKGYKTLCVFKFLNPDKPRFVLNLPKIDSWYDSPVVIEIA